MINADTLTAAWVDGTLRENDVYIYLRENLKILSGNFSPEELRHVAMCCHHLYEWSNKGCSYLPGSFLQAVINNDLRAACDAADGINQRALCLYLAFLFNVAPANWRHKVSGEEDENA